MPTKLARSEKYGPQVCKLLNIRSDKVFALSLDFSPGELVKGTVKFYCKEDELKTVVKFLKDITQTSLPKAFSLSWFRYLLLPTTQELEITRKQWTLS